MTFGHQQQQGHKNGMLQCQDRLYNCQEHKKDSLKSTTFGHDLRSSFLAFSLHPEWA